MPKKEKASPWKRSEDYAKKVSGEIIEQIKKGTAPWQKTLEARADATVQVCATGATLPFGPRCRSESFPIGSVPAEIGSSPDVEDAFFFGVGSGHGSVINPRPYGTSSIFGP